MGSRSQAQISHDDGIRNIDCRLQYGQPVNTADTRKILSSSHSILSA